MQSFREVKVWEKSHQLCLHLHNLTQGFPAAEQAGLALQMRRAAAYVPCKIADACGRSVDKDVARHLESARGYAVELEYFLLLARDLGYLSEEAHAAAGEQMTEVQKMLYGFLRYVKARMNGEKTGAADKAEIALP
jgi:four helix bundle protein